jgi:hypothetical protein
MRKIAKGIYVEVKITLTRNDWELYTPKTAEEITAQELAVQEVNKTLEDCLNQELPTHEIVTTVYEVMYKHLKMGFIDSEPMGLLDQILRKFERKKR